ncbi:hypothetical protein F5050DRAFT_1581778 [Lentinula boryana]|uniref:BTB domain-containing protein n=1 Tax=Lentinula boryana TaxID=40481 RepID=A0ABQ8PYS3_9AGAR|nr:hypothetical protein F5050DRAFT_1581778 [Lentinula boryana]
MTLYCPLTVDVVVQSSNGDRFGAHSKNLEFFTDAFPVTGSTLPPQNGEVVELSESSEIIHFMLAFTHNLPPPNVTSLELGTLLVLGEAMNKYGMYLASEYVTAEMNRRIPDEPLKILAYKAKVSDFSLIDETARRTMKLPLPHVLSELDPSAFRIWVRLSFQSKD